MFNPAWMLVPSPSFLPPKDDPTIFIQDILGSDAVKREKSDVESKKPADDSNTQLLREAAAWPSTAPAQNCYVPYVAAAFTSFYALPVYYPETGIGYAIAVGYFVGAVAYAVRFQNKIFVKQ